MEYKIYVGSLIKVKKGFFKGSFQIMYCGMSNEDTFVLAPHVASGYQGFSPNIYYKKDLKLIHLMDVEFDVIMVTPEYIILGD